MGKGEKGENDKEVRGKKCYKRKERGKFQYLTFV